MCNGDLGMYRVMPWAYPTIPGQSSGGTSVDPTPEPAKDPFDATNLSISFRSRTVNTSTVSTFTFIHYYVEVSGIEILDSSNVSSVKISAEPSDISLSPSTISGITPGITYPPVDISGNKINELNRGYLLVQAIWPDLKSNGVPVTINGNLNITIEAFDSNGEIIQSISGVTE